MHAHEFITDVAAGALALERGGLDQAVAQGEVVETGFGEALLEGVGHAGLPFESSDSMIRSDEASVNRR
jgi:hypothetical protein